MKFTANVFFGVWFCLAGVAAQDGKQSVKVTLVRWPYT